MAREKRYLYLVDNLTPERGDIIKKGLRTVSSITGIAVDVPKHIVEVTATGNPDSHVQLACDVAGTTIRTKLKKRHIG